MVDFPTLLSQPIPYTDLAFSKLIFALIVFAIGIIVAGILFGTFRKGLRRTKFPEIVQNSL